MSTTFTLDGIAVAQIILATVLPLLVGLVTTRVTSSAAKAWLLAGLSLATSVLAEAVRVWTAGEAFDVGVALLAAIPTFIVSVSVHYGLLKPSGATAVVQDVGDRRL